MSASKGLNVAGIAIGIIAIALSGYLLATVPSQLATMRNDLDTALSYQARTRAFTIIMGEGEIVGENATTGEEIIIGEFHRWEPDTMTVMKGDTVQLTVKNPRSHAHSFVLTDFAVDSGRIAGRAEQPNEALRTKTVTFVADKAGVFKFSCGISFDPATHEETLDCDPDHARMVGYLVVLEP